MSSGLETASRSTARAAEVGLFDREDALRSLLQRYDEVRDTGSLGIVAVSGDAGLGKTRLLIEFEARLRAGDDVPRVAYGRALASNSVGNGFQPLREALADLLVEEEKKGRDRLRRLGSLIKETAPDWLDALPIVGGVLHAAAVTAQHATASESVPDSMNAQFAALLELVAGDRPVVLLLDDLHWADASTVDLLFFLSQRLRKPVLLVLAYRALDLRGREDHHPLRQTLWRMERYCPVQPVELRPLTAASLTRLAEQVLASTTVDPDLVRWLARASEGNPLYVQEYLWFLQDTHAKAHDSPEWITSFDPADAEDTVGLPRTLEAIVAERIEDLGYEDLRVLQLAAVIGPVFGRDELLALSDMGAEPTKRALRFLCQRIGLVRATESGNAYTFYHGVIRDYVRQRHEADDPLDYREVNRLRADYLAERPVDRLDWHEDVALHFHEARADEEALIYALEAAEAARGVGALSEAIRFLGWAVEHADRGGYAQESVSTRWQLGSAQQELIRTDEAVRSLEEAAARQSRAQLGEVEQFDLLLEVARAHRMEEDWAKARGYLGRARAIEGPVDADRRAYLRLVDAEINLSGEPRDLSAAEALLDEAEALAASPRHLAGIYGHQAFVALARDRVQDSWNLFEEVSRLAAVSGSTGRVYESHLWRAKHHLACLRLTDAQHELDVMAELAERLGVGQTVAHHRRDSGRRLALAGQPAQAAAEYAAYLSHMLDNQAWTSRAITYLLLQAHELADQVSPAAAAEFLADLSGCVGDAPQLEIFKAAARSMHGALARPDDPRTGLRQAGLEGYLITPASAATNLIFRFHIDDLASFRRRHGFAVDTAH